MTLHVTNEGETARKSFLVSSIMLKRASKVFADILDSKSSAYKDLAPGEKLVISLTDDDIPTVDHILDIIHQRYPPPPNSLWPGPRRLTLLATHCDIYDLTQALKPWFDLWCKMPPAGSGLAMKELGYMLVAGYLTESPSFSVMAVQASRELVPVFANEFAGTSLWPFCPEACWVCQPHWSFLSRSRNAKLSG